MRDVCYLAGADDHVVNSWFERQGPRYMAQTAFDPVPGHRIPGTLRDDEPDTRRSRKTWTLNHDYGP
jgi:hypothetical protein